MDGMDQYSSSMIFASSFSPNLLTETLSMELFLSALRNHRTKKYLELFEIKYWVRVLNLVDSFLKGYLDTWKKVSFVSSSDLTNYSKLKESEAYLKDTEDLKYVLRFLSILLSSTVDKQLFLSVELLLEFLYCLDDEIGCLALEVLTSLAIPPMYHRCHLVLSAHVTQLHSRCKEFCIPLFSILSACFSWGNKKPWVPISQFLSSDSSFDFNLLQVNILEFPFMSSINKMGASEYIDMSEDRRELVDICNDFFDRFSLRSENQRLIMLWKIRLCRWKMNLGTRINYVYTLYRTITILLNCYDNAYQLANVFDSKYGVVDDFLFLLESGPGSSGFSPGFVPIDVRLLVLHCFHVIFGCDECQDAEIFGKFNNLINRLGLGKGQYMGLLPSLLRSSAMYMASIPNERILIGDEEPLHDGFFVNHEHEERLLWIEGLFLLCSPITSQNHQLKVHFSESGLISSVIDIMKLNNAPHNISKLWTFVVGVAIVSLDNSLNTTSTCNTFLRLDGLEHFINRLHWELSCLGLTSKNKKVNLESISNLEPLDISNLATGGFSAHRIIVQHILSVLEVVADKALQDSRHHRMVQQFRGRLFVHALSVIYSNPVELSYDVLSVADSLVRSIINRDPSLPLLLNHFISSGLVDLILVSIVSNSCELTDTLLLERSHLLHSLGLTNEGLEIIISNNPFRSLFEVFQTLRYSFPNNHILMGENMIEFGEHMLDILKQYPNLCPLFFKEVQLTFDKLFELAAVHMNGSTNNKDDYSRVIHMISSFLIFLRTVIAREGIIASFLDANGLFYLVKCLQCASGRNRYFLVNSACSLSSTISFAGAIDIIDGVNQCFSIILGVNPVSILDSMCERIEQELLRLNDLLCIYWRNRNIELTVPDMIIHFIESLPRNLLYDDIESVVEEFSCGIDVLKHLAFIGYLINSIFPPGSTNKFFSLGNHCSEKLISLISVLSKYLPPIISGISKYTQLDLIARAKNKKIKKHPSFVLRVVAESDFFVKDSCTPNAKELYLVPKGTILIASERILLENKNMMYKIENGWVSTFSNNSFFEPLLEVVDVFPPTDPLDTPEDQDNDPVEFSVREFESLAIYDISCRRAGYIVFSNFSVASRSVFRLASQIVSLCFRSNNSVSSFSRPLSDPLVQLLEDMTRNTWMSCPSRVDTPFDLNSYSNLSSSDFKKTKVINRDDIGQWGGFIFQSIALLELGSEFLFPKQNKGDSMFICLQILQSNRAILLKMIQLSVDFMLLGDPSYNGSNEVDKFVHHAILKVVWEYADTVTEFWMNLLQAASAPPKEWERRAPMSDYSPHGLRQCFGFFVVQELIGLLQYNRLHMFPPVIIKKILRTVGQCCKTTKILFVDRNRSSPQPREFRFPPNLFDGFSFSFPLICSDNLEIQNTILHICLSRILDLVENDIGFKFHGSYSNELLEPSLSFSRDHMTAFSLQCLVNMLIVTDISCAKICFLLITRLLKRAGEILSVIEKTSSDYERLFGVLYSIVVLALGKLSDSTLDIGERLAFPFNSLFVLAGCDLYLDIWKKLLFFLNESISDPSSCEEASEHRFEWIVPSLLLIDSLVQVTILEEFDVPNDLVGNENVPSFFCDNDYSTVSQYVLKTFAKYKNGQEVSDAEHAAQTMPLSLSLFSEDILIEVMNVGIKALSFFNTTRRHGVLKMLPTCVVSVKSRPDLSNISTLTSLASPLMMSGVHASIQLVVHLAGYRNCRNLLFNSSIIEELMKLNVVYPGVVFNIQTLLRRFIDDETSLLFYIGAEMQDLFNHNVTEISSFVKQSLPFCVLDPEIYMRLFLSCVSRNSTNSFEWNDTQFNKLIENVPAPSSKRKNPNNNLSSDSASKKLKLSTESSSSIFSPSVPSTPEVTKMYISPRTPIVVSRILHQIYSAISISLNILECESLEKIDDMIGKECYSRLSLCDLLEVLSNLVAVVPGVATYVIRSKLPKEIASFHFLKKDIKLSNDFVPFVINSLFLSSKFQLSSDFGLKVRDVGDPSFQTSQRIKHAILHRFLGSSVSESSVSFIFSLLARPGDGRKRVLRDIIGLLDFSDGIEITLDDQLSSYGYICDLLLNSLSSKKLSSFVNESIDVLYSCDALSKLSHLVPFLMKDKSHYPTLNKVVSVINFLVNHNHFKTLSMKDMRQITTMNESFESSLEDFSASYHTNGEASSNENVVSDTVPNSIENSRPNSSTHDSNHQDSSLPLGLFFGRESDAVDDGSNFLDSIMDDDEESEDIEVVEAGLGDEVEQEIDDEDEEEQDDDDDEDDEDDEDEDDDGDAGGDEVILDEFDVGFDRHHEFESDDGNENENDEDEVHDDEGIREEEMDVDEENGNGIHDSHPDHFDMHDSYEEIEADDFTHDTDFAGGWMASSEDVDDADRDNEAPPGSLRMSGLQRDVDEDDDSWNVDDAEDVGNVMSMLFSGRNYENVEDNSLAGRPRSRVAPSLQWSRNGDGQRSVELNIVGSGSPITFHVNIDRSQDSVAVMEQLVNRSLGMGRWNTRAPNRISSHSQQILQNVSNSIFRDSFSFGRLATPTRSEERVSDGTVPLASRLLQEVSRVPVINSALCSMDSNRTSERFQELTLSCPFSTTAFYPTYTHIYRFLPRPFGEPLNHSSPVPSEDRWVFQSYITGGLRNYLRSVQNQNLRGFDVTYYLFAHTDLLVHFSHRIQMIYSMVRGDTSVIVNNNPSRFRVFPASQRLLGIPPLNVDGSDSELVNMITERFTRDISDNLNGNQGLMNRIARNDLENPFAPLNNSVSSIDINNNVATSGSSDNIVEERLPCPSYVDESVWEVLPRSAQLDILHGSGNPEVNSISPSVTAGASSGSESAISQENINFVNSLPLDLRMDVLVAAEPEFLSTLSPEMQGEARILRRSHGMHSFERSSLFEPAAPFVPPADPSPLLRRSEKTHSVEEFYREITLDSKINSYKFLNRDFIYGVFLAIVSSTSVRNIASVVRFLIGLCSCKEERYAVVDVFCGIFLKSESCLSRALEQFQPSHHKIYDLEPFLCFGIGQLCFKNVIEAYLCVSRRTSGSFWYESLTRKCCIEDMTLFQSLLKNLDFVSQSDSELSISSTMSGHLDMLLHVVQDILAPFGKFTVSQTNELIAQLTGVPISNDMEISDVMDVSTHSESFVDMSQIMNTSQNFPSSSNDDDCKPQKVLLPFPIISSNDVRVLGETVSNKLISAGSRKRLMKILRVLSNGEDNWHLLLRDLSNRCSAHAAIISTLIHDLVGEMKEISRIHRDHHSLMIQEIQKLDYFTSFSSSNSQQLMLHTLETLTSLRSKKPEKRLATDPALLLDSIKTIEFGDLWEVLCDCLDIIRDAEGVRDHRADESISSSGSQGTPPGPIPLTRTNSSNRRMSRGSIGSGRPNASTPRNSSSRTSQPEREKEELKQFTSSSLTVRFMSLIQCFYLVYSVSIMSRSRLSDKDNTSGNGAMSLSNAFLQFFSGSGVLHVYREPSFAKELSSLVSPGQRFRQHSEYRDVQFDVNDADDSGMMLSKLCQFTEKNRVLLNAILKGGVHLLDSSFSPLLHIPRCRHYLHFDIKRAYFRWKLKKLRSAVAHSAPLNISCRRKEIFVDSFRQLQYQQPDALKSKIQISFVGEEGLDAGGLTREWFSLLAKEIFNPNYALFTATSDHVTFQPNPQSFFDPDHLKYFKFVGRIIGKALFDGHLFDAHFTRSFYKHILGIPVIFSDLEAMDPDYYKSLRHILETPLDFLGLDLTFTGETDDFGNIRVFELIENGANLEVNDDNKYDYVRLIAHHRMTVSIQKQIDAFLEGFHELIPPELISIFDANELELLISGLPDIDLDDMKANTDYVGYKSTDHTITYFWNTLKSFSKEDKALFLQFLTGTSKVPLEGFKSLRGSTGICHFSIHKDGRGTNLLPCAHTCFNQLDLPEYQTEEELRHKLLLAIKEGSEGFGFV